MQCALIYRVLQFVTFLHLMYRSESSSSRTVTPTVATRYSAGAAASARGAIKWLGICFLFLFGAFQAAQGLQSSLNTNLGLINLALLYGVFAVSLLEAPRMVAALERRFDGLPWVLALAGTSFVAAIAVNLVHPPVEASWHWGVYACSFAVLGVGAATLWTAQAEYLGRCAVAATRRSGLVSAATSELNSLFFSFFQFSGFLGCLITTFLYTDRSSRERLFIWLSLIATVGIIAFLGLPRQELVLSVGASPSSRPGGAREIFSVSFSSAFVRLVVLIFTNGLMLGFFFGPMLESVVTTTLGPQWVSKALMVFFAVNSLSTRLWGWLRGAGSAIVAALLVGAVGVYLLVRDLPQNFVLDGATGEWVQVAEFIDFRSLSIEIVSLVSGFALGDSFFESQLPATIQGDFQMSGSSLEANAAYKFWQTLGTATQLVLALIVPVQQQLVVLLSFLILGLWSSRVRPGLLHHPIPEEQDVQHSPTIQV